MRDYTVIAAAFAASAAPDSAGSAGPVGADDALPTRGSAAAPDSTCDFASGCGERATRDMASADSAEHLRELTGCAVRVVPVIIPPTFSGAWSAVEQAIDAHHPDVVLLLGHAPGAHGVELERYAMNRVDVAKTDAEGAAPRSSIVINGSPAAYWTRLPLHHILDSFAAHGVPAAVTSNAGDSLRNAVFYRILNWCAHTPDALGGLMELPDLRAEDKRAKTGITAVQMRQACELLVAQTVLYCSDMAASGHIIVEKRG